MKTDTLAIAMNSTSASFRAKNPHLFKSIALPIDEANDAPNKKGKRRKEMNKTEAEFAALLDAKIARHEVDSWAYEEITLRWPDGMRYTPDFVVIKATGVGVFTETVLIEVKGAHAWAKDVVKFRAARDKWGDRFKFEFYQKIDGIWQETR